LAQELAVVPASAAAAFAFLATIIKDYGGTANSSPSPFSTFQLAHRLL
jgi:hypothetical protein